MVTMQNENLLHNIPHVNQRFRWDCGIACVLMVISEKHRMDFLSNFTAICRNEELNESTWTIDLCHLLKRFNVDHCMYTSKIRINRACPNSSKRRSVQDIKRVHKRLEDASRYGLKIHEGTLGTEAVMSHVLKYGPAIVLVDSTLLACDQCKRNKLTSELRSVWGGRYQGHYIALVGMSHSKVLYRDPAGPGLCVTSTSRLDAARRAPATDRDVILVYK